MPTVLIRGNAVNTEEPFELKGFAGRPVTSVFVEKSILGRETVIPITGLGGETEPPDPVLSAHILGMPVQATELTTITTLSAELRDDDTPPNVVELYDPANWTWAVVSGGGSFGGVDGDELQLPAAPATVVVSATHDDGLGTTASVLVQVVAVLTPDFFSLPAQLIEGQQTNPLRSRVLNSDGSTAEEINTNWSYAVISGPGSISGPIGNQVLNANAGSAGNNITVRATYTGPLNVSPATDDSTTSSVEQPDPGDFDEVLEPAGMTTILDADGSSKTFPGWTQSTKWADNQFVEVISDPLSKFGQAIEKRMFVGNESGWHGLTFDNFFNAGQFQELYGRMVFRFSTNWQFHSSGGKYWYWGRAEAPSSPTQFLVSPHPAGHLPIINQAGSSAGRNPSFPNGNDNGAYYPNLPQVTRGTYHTLEILHRMNTPGNADGYWRIALDGQIATQWRRNNPAGDIVSRENVEFLRTGFGLSSLKFTGAEAAFFWGGQGDTKQVNDNVRISEFYLSGRN